MNLETILEEIKQSYPNVIIFKNIYYNSNINSYNWIIVQDCEIKVQIIKVDVKDENMHNISAIAGYFYYNASNNLFYVNQVTNPPAKFEKCTEQSIFDKLELSSLNLSIVHEKCKNELDLLYDFYFDLWKKKFNGIIQPTTYISLIEFLEIQSLKKQSNITSFKKILNWNDKISPENLEIYGVNDLSQIPFFDRKENDDIVILSKPLSPSDCNKFLLTPADIHIETQIELALSSLHQNELNDCIDVLEVLTTLETLERYEIGMYFIKELKGKTNVSESFLLMKGNYGSYDIDGLGEALFNFIKSKTKIEIVNRIEDVIKGGHKTGEYKYQMSYMMAKYCKQIDFNEIKKMTMEVYIPFNYLDSVNEIMTIKIFDLKKDINKKYIRHKDEDFDPDEFEILKKMISNVRTAYGI